MGNEAVWQLRNAMRVLIFGKSGQVGTELQRFFANRSEYVLALGLNDGGGDITQFEDMIKVVADFHPNLVFNAAAYTAVDKAEEEKDLAYKVNAEAVSVMARACEAIESVLIHYGTDYVFDGSGNEARDERAPTGPLNYYGKTKLAGEEGIRSTCAKALIFRTSWVFSSHGRNFIKTILDLAQRENSLKIVSDQVGTPTSAHMIAEVSAQLGLRAAKGEISICGLYNLVPNGFTNWCDLARYAVSYAQKEGLVLKLDPEHIKSIKTEEYLTIAKRPKNSRLNNQKVSQVFRGEIRDWKFYLDEVLKEIVTNRVES